MARDAFETILGYLKGYGFRVGLFRAPDPFETILGYLKDVLPGLTKCTWRVLAKRTLYEFT